jgi:hypothetical protein
VRKLFETKCGYKFGIGTFDGKKQMLEQLDKDYPKLGKILKTMDKMGELSTTELQQWFYKSYTLLELQQINHAWTEASRRRPRFHPDKGVALLMHFQREGK